MDSRKFKQQICIYVHPPESLLSQPLLLVLVATQQSLQRHTPLRSYRIRQQELLVLQTLYRFAQGLRSFFLVVYYHA
jgi:hypothetical protein